MKKKMITGLCLVMLSTLIAKAQTSCNCTRFLINGAVDDGSSALQVLGSVTTTGPVAQLQFNSRQADNKNYLWYSDGGTARLHYTPNGLDRFAVTSTGMVGIGTVTPTHQLEVVGSIMSTGNIAQLQFNSRQADGKDYVWYSSDGVARLYYAPNGQERLFVTSNGDVGIGTINPQSKLAVAGTITAQKVKVSITGWSDFVFEDNYPLRSLAEIEMFIKANKHLPEIPSAKEVEKEGLDLGEMNKKLLQKIEELTLHLIEQQKEIAAQHVRIKNLEGKP